MLIGSGGSGKSTLAVKLGERLGLRVTHLDTLYWKPGWIETPKDEWREIVRELVTGEAWIIDGNYSGTMDIRFAACDTVIFLDFPRITCVFRAIKRRVNYRKRIRPDMAEGCSEKLDWEYLKWIWTYPARNRKRILLTLKELERNKQVFILRSNKDIKIFLSGLF